MPHEAIDYSNESNEQPVCQSPDFAQRSELAQEIISQKSGFIERWALVIFSIILLLILTAAWLIKYPDTIEASAVLTAANAPKEIIPRQEGRLVKLFIQNNENVSQGEVIGWIESTAKHDEVLELSTRIDSSVNLLNTKQEDKVAQLFTTDYTNLGEMQQDYQTFITALQSFNDFLVNGFYTKKKSMLSNDLQSLENTSLTIQKQKALTQQDIKLAEETYNMNKQLSDEKVLSKEEFRQEHSKFINKQMEIPQLDADLLSNEMQQRDREKELDQLNHDMQRQPENFQQALQSLKSEVDDWKKKYILQSPINGKVSYIISFQENQFLQQGKLIGYITPDDSHFYTQAYLPQNNFGKVNKGQHVQLRFDAYPYQEFGFVEGTVSYVSNVASDSGFLTTIQLSNGFVTSDKIPIAYKNGLKAQALIITQNMRLLSRLWYNIKKSVSVQKKT